MLSKKFTYRFEILGLLVIAVFLALGTRLFYLQIVEGEHYKGLADGNRIRLTPIMAPRGIFYDKKGVPLVTNRPGFAVSLQPSLTYADGMLNQLATMLGVPKQEILQRLERGKDSVEPIRIKSDISPAMVTRIEERRQELPGVVIEIQPVRAYNYNELAAHVVGYVGEISERELAEAKDKNYRLGTLIGKMGLEKLYDQQLRGVDGGDRVEVDVAGRVVHDLGRREPLPGNNLYLTIDYELQAATEKAVDEHLAYIRTAGGSPNAYGASVVAMDPRNGAVLALVSRPAFNPNLFATGISVSEWKKINDNPFHPMDNKAIGGEYPPGSTFKIVTGLAALEERKVTPEEKIFDSGTHWLVPKGNADGEALGWLNFYDALAKSDNVYFYEMGNRLGIDLLEHHTRVFGFGALTGINLPGEAEGLVANRKYKEKVFQEDWYLAETFDAAIGQGFQLATPLQVAVMMSSVANGGIRYQPYLIDRIVSDQGKEIQAFKPFELGRLPYKRDYIQLVQQSLRGVALEGGTAAQLAKFPIPLAGKTSTAENSHGKDHGWFVCYAPFDNPEIVVVVMVEQGGYGTTAAVPIAQKVLETAFHIAPPPPPGTAGAAQAPAPKKTN